MKQEQIRAGDAKSLLDNPVFRGAIKAVSESVESAALTCIPDDKDKCARIITSKQLLKAIEREIFRYIENGEVQDIIELQARKEAKKPEFKR